MTFDWDVIVVGAGAAGLLAAIRAAERGRRTLLLEKNRKAGVKILMSGGTRCNITHDADRPAIVKAFGRKQGSFLQSPLARLGPRELAAMVQQMGVPLKTEETGKLFPVSNKALDILNAFLSRLEHSGARLGLAEPVLEMKPADGGFLVRTPLRAATAAKLIVTTGGLSYPGCGTTGDGYPWMRAVGHTIVPTKPALTSLTSAAAWVAELKGLTLPDVTVRIVDPTASDSKKSLLDERRGSFLFTHFGFSGPAVMNASRVVSDHPRATELIQECDFLPDMRPDEWDETIRRETAASGKRLLSNVLAAWIPGRLAETVTALAGLPPDRKAAELPKAERAKLVQYVKRLPAPLSGTMGYAKAEVTAGGVALEEIDSRTMESKRQPGLHVAGELLDIDGPIGGFNFTAAFATGLVAGESV
ncbi:MAG: NAD(P)/FAD-dependent oxidoreductase [Planctomycetia bacterium]